MRIFRELFILLVGLMALFYMLIDPLQIDLIPDFIPLVGWIDDGMAITVLISVLKHYGLDLTGIIGERGENAKELEAVMSGTQAQGVQAQSAPQAQNDAIEVQDGRQRIRIPRHVLEDTMRQYGYDPRYKIDGYSQPDPRLTQRRE